MTICDVCHLSGLQGVTRFTNSRESQDGCAEDVDALLISRIHLHSEGMSSARVKPRCSITCIPARQLWHPVSAITEEVRGLCLPAARSLSPRSRLL